MSAINYRPFKMEDYEECAKIWKDNGQFEGPLQSEEAIAKVFLNHADFFWVAETDDEIIGVVLAVFDGRMAYVQGLSIKESSQGKGIGSHLMQLIETKVKELDGVGIFCVTDKSRTDTITFYENRGFDKVPEIIYLLKKL